MQDAMQNRPGDGDLCFAYRLLTRNTEIIFSVTADGTRTSMQRTNNGLKQIPEVTHLNKYHYDLPEIYFWTNEPPAN